jgi:hypothetical protein
MREPMLKNSKIYSKKYSRYLIICFLIFSFSLSFWSCKSVSKTIGDTEVYLYDGQASLMNGTYFVDPYEHYGQYKLLTDIFDLRESKVPKKVDFDFIDDRHLKISYSDGIGQYTKIIEGKMKNGGFRYEYKNLPLGIPLLFFVYQFKVHHIALGNDDNIIITEYDSQSSQLFFSIFNTTKTENRYYFDRQLN